MNLSTILLYTINGAICMTLCIMLVLVNNSSSTASYKRIKRIQAFEACLDIIVDVMVIIFCMLGLRETVLNGFIIPFVFSMELLLETVVFLRLLHSDYLNWRKILMLSLIPVVLLGIHLTKFVSQYGLGLLNFKDYALFVQSDKTNLLGGLLSGYIVFEAVYCFYVFISEAVYFRKELDGIYSGERVLKGKRLVVISYAFVAFFLLAMVDSVLDSASFDFIFMILNGIIYITMAVCLFNAESIYSETNLVGKYLDVTDRSNDDDDDDNIAAASKDTYRHSQESIIDKISAWATSESKNYLDDDLTLMKVSGDIGISPRQLSWYLNKIENINFNIWINTLKIEEAKRLMDDDDNFIMTIKEIAYKVGFSSPERMSKVFKNITGITATDYRKSNM